MWNKLFHAIVIPETIDARKKTNAALGIGAPNW